jgi:hypothetical protein
MSKCVELRTARELTSCTATQVSTCHHLMQLVGVLLHSQEAFNVSYPEPDQSSSYRPILPLQETQG